jgi:polyhydroxyalkanoate synthesis regulator phasin
MKKSLGAALAAALVVGGLTGAALGGPGLAAAAGNAGGAVTWVQDALDGLVDDGTITQDQADAVEAALDEARPGRGPGHGHGHGHGRRDGSHHGAGLAAVAEALDLSADELHRALRDGSTLAELAEERGVESDALVGTIVDARRRHLDEAVAAGRLTQERADELLAGAEERAQAVVDGEVPALRHGPRGGGRGNGPGPLPGQDDEAEAEGTGTSA